MLRKIHNWIRTEGKKTVSIYLVVLLVANQFLVPVVVAEELEVETEIISPLPEQPASPEESANQQDNEQAEDLSEPSPSPSATPTPEPEGSASIDTGDAGALADSDNTTNYNETQTQGKIETDETCNVGGTLDCDIETENDSTTDNSTLSDADTGDNTIEGNLEEASITTGDATAQSNSDNLINTNIVEANSDEPSSDSAELETEDDNNNQTSVADIDNTADHKQQTDADAASGNNDVNSAQEASIDTGDAISSANQVNVVNTNVIASNFDFILRDIVSDESGDIDLNKLWKLLEEQGASLDSATLNHEDLFIYLANNANLELEAQATAVSGENSAIGEEARIDTGNAYASANIFNLVNLNIIGSNILFAVINVFGSLEGNIIVPNLERFETSTAAKSPSPNSDTTYALNNDTELTSTVASEADSGQNLQLGETLTLETGDTLAASGSTNFVNLNLLLSNWYLLLLNNFGFWDGNVVSWQNPTSSITQEDRAGNYANVPPLEGQETAITSNDNPHTLIDIENKANVSAHASAQAVSGRNLTEGTSSYISTGRSVALANLFNFINTNIIGGRIFMPIINLFGSWTGDLVFAFPDLMVSINSDRQEVGFGDVVNYSVSFENEGYEVAQNASINITLPSEEHIVSHTGPAPTTSGNTYLFTIGDIQSGQQGSFSFSTIVEQVSPQAQAQNPSLLSSLIKIVVPEVHAAEPTKTLTTTALIGSPDSESDTSNNSSSITKQLIPAEEEFEVTNDSIEEYDGEEIIYTEPFLKVTSYHNVNSYVYPGDIVTFSVQTANHGNGTAHDAIVYQEIYTQSGQFVTENQFGLGNISPGASKKISFGLHIPASAPAGIYTSIISTDALTGNNVIVSSDISETNFEVKSKGLSLVKSAHATDLGDVLAVKDDAVNAAKKDYLPYLLAASAALLWFVETVRRRRLQSELKKLLDKISN